MTGVDAVWLPDVLAERARQNPGARAYTFIDYDIDPVGYVETVTWAEINQRVESLAREIASCGSPGDRVAICAPHGLEYILGFLGALRAGFVAVPLPAPAFGAYDERVSVALQDSSPTAMLTTSAVVNDVVGLPGLPPAVIEVDAVDLRAAVPPRRTDPPRADAALLQYTSGSTRTPSGVVVTHRNVITNLRQMMSDHYGPGNAPPPGTTVVSWLPFQHDLGLQFGILYPIVAGTAAVVMSPTAFLQKPARWMQLLAGNTRAFSGAPNFAFELAVRRTSDDDMAGRDLGDVLNIASGGERVHPATIRRFMQRFSRFNLPATALRPGYGLAEATVYVSSSDTGRPPVTARFDYEQLSVGHASRRAGEDGVELVGLGSPRACTVRIVDPETRAEKPADEVGEIWVHGDNVAAGYWGRPHLTRQTFRAQLVAPSPGTPLGPWLRTGDLGVISGGELFFVGRIKDVVIVDGRNHYPDDVEATIHEIAGGRVAAIAVSRGHCEQLVAIAEIKHKTGHDGESRDALRAIKNEVTAAVSKTHRVRIADIVLVGPGSIPITTSGKVRRSACAQRYRHGGFDRLDAMTRADEAGAIT